MSIVNAIFAPAQQVLEHWEQWLPPFLLAMAVLVAGWVLARLLRFVAVKALRTINFHVLAERAGLDGFLRQGGAGTDTNGVLGILVAALVVLMAVALALNAVGLAYAAGITMQMASFVPRLMAAVVLLTLGLYFSRVVAHSVSLYAVDQGLEDAPLLGRFAQSAVMVFVVLIVLDEIQVGRVIIRDTFLIVLGGVMLALALAFGLGGQKWAAGILERQWPRDASRSSRKAEG
ncbi:MAG: mechanosensitive ion channel family protein [Acidiferrobacter sp.]